MRGCAALCSFGSASGLVACLNELSYHVRFLLTAIALEGLSLCLGVILGLWLPQRLIRTWIARANSATDGSVKAPGTDNRPAQPRAASEFIASLTGGLIAALGLAWVLVWLVVDGLETGRAFLAARLALPAPLMRGLLVAPLCALLALVGALGTTVVLALRGWRRLVFSAPVEHTRLWVGTYLGAALGGGMLTITASTGVLVLATLPPVFAAAILAVCWRLTPEQPGTQPQTGLAFVFGTVPSRRLRTVAFSAAALWLLIVSSIGEFGLRATDMRSRAALAPAHPEGQSPGRALMAAAGGDGLVIEASNAATGAASGWEVDYGGAHWSLLVIARPMGENGTADKLDRRAGRRLLRRCDTALRRGGYLAVELPAGDLAAAALDLARSRRLAGWRSYVLRVTDADGSLGFLLVGPDVPAWVSHHAWPEGAGVTLKEVERPRELEPKTGG